MEFPRHVTIINNVDGCIYIPEAPTLHDCYYYFDINTFLHEYQIKYAKLEKENEALLNKIDELKIKITESKKMSKLKIQNYYNALEIAINKIQKRFDEKELQYRDTDELMHKTNAELAASNIKLLEAETININLELKIDNLEILNSSILKENKEIKKKYENTLSQFENEIKEYKAKLKYYEKKNKSDEDLNERYLLSESINKNLNHEISKLSDELNRKTNSIKEEYSKKIEELEREKKNILEELLTTNKHFEDYRRCWNKVNQYYIEQLAFYEKKT